MTRTAGGNARSVGYRLAHAIGTLILGTGALWALEPRRRAAPPPPDGQVQWSAAPEASAAAMAIEARLGGGRPSPGDPTGDERQALARLYAPGRGEPLWVRPSGSLTADADDALSLIAAAPADGLDPADYRLATLTAQAVALERARPPDPERIADADLTLSAGVLRYFQHLHLGRIDPRAIGVRLIVEPEGHDFVQLLHAALATHSLRATAARLAPPLPQYAALRRELARYRAIGEVPLDPMAGGVRAVRPGDSYPAAAALRRRLVTFGDLPADAPRPEDDTYDETLAGGVRRFQARHGLEPDGVIGRATRAALDVPVAQRIRQIELALERLRWLPDFEDERVIALNIPMFRLWTSTGVPAGEPGPAMRAIVGRALITETPVFAAHLRSVVFRPYWNVPRSILLKEILPQVRRHPELMERGDFEAVRGQSDAAEVVPPGPSTLAGLRAGTLRLRQRPGPANALGLVKFVFPNDADVYLHGTPAVELFSRARRDFSHGCIRVEEPAALAEWVLAEEGGWDRARVEAAMAAAAPSTVELSRPIRVVLFYTTAVVVPADGGLHFADDIYDHDARLDAALARRRPRS